MNILQCALSLYQLVYLPRAKVYCSEPPILRGYIVGIQNPDTITIMSVGRVAPIYTKSQVKIAGIITSQLHSPNPDEQNAAKYAIKQMKYRFLEKYAVIENYNNGYADVRCGSEYIRKWMVANRLAVREVGKP
jgi:hypothetical protein